MKDPDVDKEGDKFGDGWKPQRPEKIEAVVNDQIAIPKEAKDFVTKLRQKYGLPIGEKQS
jgi:hypothetical protein